jgi:murein DD-endopeptidase MepM/ murein hydrolase activator NlpD
MSAHNKIRSATRMERNRAKAIALGSFVIVLMVTAAITLTTVSLTGGPGTPKKEDPGEEVSTAIVFAVPVQNYTSILKNCSLTELQYNETMQRWESHKMVTIAAPLGSAVVATFAGTVTSVQDHTMHGRQVTIEHRDGLKTVFSNLDRNVNVSQGDRVEKGQKIGSVGQTSSIEFITTPHLRIAVYKDGKRIDPNDYIDFTEK